MENCSYFLTHYHSDHYGPLKSDFVGTIFCKVIITLGTSYTAKLLIEIHKIKATNIIVLSYDQKYKYENTLITIIDANHCPGSVMFLFETTGGSYLHTGDFRYHPELLRHPELKRYMGEKKLNVLFLDTTYAKPEYIHPMQTDMIMKVIEIIKRERNDDSIFYFGSYTIGKERVFLEVAKYFNIKLHVTKFKNEVLLLNDYNFNINDYLTTDAENTNFFVCSMQIASMKSQYHYTDNTKRYIGILPTGWTMKVHCEKVEENKLIYHIPYSEHSSFTELQTFTNNIRYNQIISTVLSTKSILKFFKSCNFSFVYYK